MPTAASLVGFDGSTVYLPDCGGGQYPATAAADALALSGD
jgi:hypothetical protein